MTTDDRTALLHRGDELWELLRTALDASIDAPLGPSSNWTGRDVYAHLARWQQNTIDVVRGVLAGTAPPDPTEDEDTINNRWHEEDRTTPSDVARRRCTVTRRELRALLESLTDGQWRAFGETASADINGEHYEHHLAVIGKAAR